MLEHGSCIGPVLLGNASVPFTYEIRLHRAARVHAHVVASNRRQSARCFTIKPFGVAVSVWFILAFGCMLSFLLRACMPMTFWRRETDTSATPTVLPKPPFEARAVEEIMKLRRAGPGAVDTHGSCSTMVSSSLCEDTGRTTVSIEDRLEGQQPYDIKAWLDFRVSWVCGDFRFYVFAAPSTAVFLCVSSVCQQ